MPEDVSALSPLLRAPTVLVACIQKLCRSPRSGRDLPSLSSTSPDCQRCLSSCHVMLPQPFAAAFYRTHILIHRPSSDVQRPWLTSPIVFHQSYHFDMSTVIHFDSHRCRRPYHDGAPVIRTALALYSSFNANAAHGINLASGSKSYVNLQDHKFSAHNFFGFTQDATVFTIFHYQPDTFAICSQLNRRTHSCLRGLRRQAIRLRISESLAPWQPGPTGPWISTCWCTAPVINFSTPRTWTQLTS